MMYKVIFTDRWSGDAESLMRGYRGDVLLEDADNNFFEINFVELEVIKNRLNGSNTCYVENNLVILRKVTKENIIKSIPELHNWLFNKRWVPLVNSQVEKYYGSEKDWTIFEVSV